VPRLDVHDGRVGTARQRLAPCGSALASPLLVATAAACRRRREGRSN
jgi:hypothetical protein